jgi:hypothetical protein
MTVYIGFGNQQKQTSYCAVLVGQLLRELEYF